jgi:hypothetical protein
LGDEIKENEMGGTCSMYGEEERCIQYLVGKLEGKRPLGRPKHRLKDKIKWIFKEWDEVWIVVICQVKDRWRALVNMIINLRLP